MTPCVPSDDFEKELLKKTLGFLFKRGGNVKQFVFPLVFGLVFLLLKVGILCIE